MLNSMSEDAKTENPVTSPSATALSFAWDRKESAESLHSQLAGATPERWIELAAWILREAQIREVWEFLRPDEIAEQFDALQPRLGRRREFWTYLINTWREMGKI
jgi:hypothetical protein